ncbi:G2E3 family protein [Megaselia abdita]
MSKSHCYLCEFSDIDVLKYGQFLTDPKENISVHYFCLLLSSNLIQQGNDNEGFYGFLAKDIRKEKNRIKRQQCKYCKNLNANIACCKKTCKTFYHLKCGYTNNVLFQFKGTYMSFCQKHYNIEEKARPKKNEICHICQEDLGTFNFVKTIKAPCCKNGWYHKWCLSKYALNAGYFFKCPLCQNEKEFRNEIPFRGVFIPDKDAEWEMEPHAFQELLERPDTCSSHNCLCSKGRSYTNKGSYEFKYCLTCGSSAIHEKCLKNKTKYECIECNDLIESISSLETVQTDAYNMSELSRRLSASDGNKAGYIFDNGISIFEDHNENGATLIDNNANISNEQNKNVMTKTKRTLQDIYDDSDYEENNLAKRIKTQRASVKLPLVC